MSAINAQYQLMFITRVKMMARESTFEFCVKYVNVNMVGFATKRTKSWQSREGKRNMKGDNPGRK